jgi:DNA-binding SARP family transcriptional activator
VKDAEARLRATACQVFARSAGLLTEAGRHSDAARRYARLLDLEPTEWSWHLGLMRAFADAGEHRKALRQYQRLKVSQSEHGVNVSLPEAERLYDELIAAVT